MAFTARNQKTIAAFAVQLEDIRTKLEQIHEAESERYDEMSETAQDSDNGEAHRETLSTIEAVVSTLEEVTESLAELKPD